MGLLYAASHPPHLIMSLRLLPPARLWRRITLHTLTKIIHSALGTPLEWPDAKKNAVHVRNWGIEVCAQRHLLEEVS
jgi:hypothetical protein